VQQFGKGARARALDADEVDALPVLNDACEVHTCFDDTRIAPKAQGVGSTAYVRPYLQ
jgi:hypothetical protein